MIYDISKLFIEYKTGSLNTAFRLELLRTSNCGFMVYIAYKGQGKPGTILKVTGSLITIDRMLSMLTGTKG